MNERIHNFSAGPSTLPLSVLEQVKEEMVCLPGAGASVIEISHRSDAFEEIIEAAENNLRRLLSIPADYKILFVQGGASFQFSMIPMNFLRGSGLEANYVVTGAWGAKAIKEAAKEGAAKSVWDGKSTNYSSVPDWSSISVDTDSAYLHFTSNETIHGVQFQDMPNANSGTLICDMSSDFISRPVPVDRFGMIYAGAQKNAGPAGCTILIIREDLLDRIPDGLHTMLDYRTHASAGSMHNTPPVFSVYVIRLVTDWLLNQMGGLSGIQEINEAKANALYTSIDANEGFYEGHAEKNCRSRMNVTWRLKDDALVSAFIDEACAAGLHELKGHRSVGGIRASIYNAMTVEGVHALADFMNEFVRKNG